MKKNDPKTKRSVYTQAVSSMVTLIIGLIFALIFTHVAVKVTEAYPDANIVMNGWFQMTAVVAFLLSVGAGGIVYCAITYNSNRELAEGMQKLSTNARSIENQSLIINSFSSIFYYACFIDVKEDSFYEIIPQDFITFILGEKGRFSGAYKRFVDETVAFEYQDDVREFCDIFTLDRRLGDQKNATTEFVSNYVGWTRTYLIVLERDQKKKVSKVLLGFQKIDSQKRKELQMQEALKGALEVANSANNAKSDFLSRMSHDIRTPMNGIVGMTALAITRLDDKERVAYCLEKISDSSKHLLMLINDVLDMSRIDTGRLELSEENFSLSDLMDNLVTMIHPQTDDKHQDFICNVMNVEHEKVIGDATRLEEVFMNLTGNAVKYTPERGKIKISIFEKYIKNGMGCYEFVIEDNGVGMSEEFMRHLFEPFSREYNEKTKNIQGTGLGLAIAKNIINMMNGEMKVESALGKGSKFSATFWLKIQDGEEEKNNSFTDIHILVVDDNRVSCETNCTMLTNLGMRAEKAFGGREAINAALDAAKKGDPFTLALVDWKMPEIDGLKAIKAINGSLGNNAPTFAVFAYDWTDIEIEARRLGVKAFISKPLFKSRVVSALHQMLGDEKVEMKEQEIRQFKENDFTGRRALLVEDNELNTEIAKELLEMTGIHVECAANGAEAVELFSERGAEYFDIIFMDIQMPIMNGYDAAKAIRALPLSDAKTIPIIAMTANAFMTDVQEAKNSGMNEHVAKPVDLNRLRDVMTKWLG